MSKKLTFLSYRPTNDEQVDSGLESSIATAWQAKKVLEANGFSVQILQIQQFARVTFQLMTPSLRASLLGISESNPQSESEALPQESFGNLPMDRL